MRCNTRPPIGIPPMVPHPERQPPRDRLDKYETQLRRAEEQRRGRFLQALPEGIRQRAAEAMAAVPFGSGFEALARAVLAAVTPEDAEELRCVWLPVGK